MIKVAWIGRHGVAIYIGKWFCTFHVRKAFLIGAWIMTVSWGINLGPFEMLATKRWE